MKTTLLIAIALFMGTIVSAQNFPGKEWQKLKDPTLAGWDEAQLGTLQTYLIDSTYTTGMLVIHDGKIVFEYGNITENSYIASCRKSILAMLYGKYVKDGTINLDKTLNDLDYPEKDLLLESEKKATIRDLISARSGILLPASNFGDMQSLAPERGSREPGNVWLYNNWDFNMAGYFFEKEAKTNIYNEIEEQFAKPLQMQDWDKSIQKKSGDVMRSEVMAYHIWFSARDMARIGWLMLNKGKWGNQQLISEDWVTEMTTPKSSFEDLDAISKNIKNKYSKFSYGYMWWLMEEPSNKLLEGAYSAQGAWGQNITVIPKTKTVIIIKTNDIYSRRKVDYGYIIDLVSKSYSSESAKAMKAISTALEDEDITLFLKELRAIDQSQYSNIPFQALLNRFGYKLLEEDKFEAALTVFKANVDQHPESWNLYDSYAEAFYRSGDYENALIYYKKSIALNTKNEAGNNDRIEHILKLVELKQEKAK